MIGRIHRETIGKWEVERKQSIPEKYFILYIQVFIKVERIRFVALLKSWSIVVHTTCWDIIKSMFVTINYTNIINNEDPSSYDLM